MRICGHVPLYYFSSDGMDALKSTDAVVPAINATARVRHGGTHIGGSVDGLL